MQGRGAMRRAVAAALFAAAMCAIATGAPAADLQRGRQLYEMRCGGCHGQSVHDRSKRVATSFEEISAWVSRWSTTLALKWGADEVEDVSAFLNTTYYHFACPASVCKVTSRAPQRKKPA